MSYELENEGAAIVESSPLGITLDGVDLGSGVELGTARARDVLETFPVLGVLAVGTNRCRIADISVTHKTSGMRYQIETRMFDDGMAWRYRIPGSSARLVTGEASSWTLPAGSKVWYAERNNSWKLKSYAGEWMAADVDAMPEASSQGPVQCAPLVVELPQGGYVVLTEAAVFNYSGMRLRAVGNRRFQADFTEGNGGFEIEGEILTPWRVTLISRDLNGLVNSDVLASLCPPPDPALFGDKSWIKPGRCAWRWWSLGTGNPGEERAVVDAAARLGFEYSLVDEGWEKWQQPFETVRDLCSYARTKGVGVFVWKRYEEVASPTDDWQALRRFLRNVAQAGVAGVKFDFLNAESLERIRFEEAVLHRAAEVRLLVSFHGCRKPGGEARTYPNEVTREAVRGLELNRMAEGPITPAHNAALPFTRFVVGHGDYTPVGFSNPGLTTAAHQLATLVLFTSPMQVIAENPEYLLTNAAVRPALSVLNAVPSVWDETRVLNSSKIGELAVMARRSGGTWFLGALNGRSESAELDAVDLSFLRGKTYRAVYLSAINRTCFERREVNEVNQDSVLSLKLEPGDGFVAMFEPVE